MHPFWKFENHLINPQKYTYMCIILHMIFRYVCVSLKIVVDLLVVVIISEGDTVVIIELKF